MASSKARKNKNRLLEDENLVQQKVVVKSEEEEDDSGLSPTVDETSPLNYNKRISALIANSPNVMTRARGRKILQATSPQVDQYHPAKKIIGKKDQRKLKTKNLFDEAKEKNLTDDELIAEFERSYINEMEILDETIDRKDNIEKVEKVSKKNIKTKHLRKSECQELSERIEITKEVVAKILSKKKSIKTTESAEKIIENVRKGPTSEAEVSDDEVSDKCEYIEEKEAKKSGRIGQKGNTDEKQLKTMSDPIKIKKEVTTKKSKKKSIKSVENVEEIIENDTNGRMPKAEVTDDHNCEFIEKKEVEMTGRIGRKVEQKDLKTGKNSNASENTVEDEEEQPREGKQGGRKGRKTKVLKPVEDEKEQPKKDKQGGRKGRKTKELKTVEDEEEEPNKGKQGSRKGRSNKNEIAIKPKKKSSASTSESDVEEIVECVAKTGRATKGKEMEDKVHKKLGPSELKTKKVAPSKKKSSESSENDAVEIIQNVGKDVSDPCEHQIKDIVKKVGRLAKTKLMSKASNDNKITVKAGSKTNASVDSDSDVEVKPKLVPKEIVLCNEEVSDECKIVAKKDVKIGKKVGGKGSKTKKDLDESKITVKNVSKINESVNSGVEEKKGRQMSRNALEDLSQNIEQKLMLSDTTTTTTDTTTDSESDVIEIDDQTAKLVKKYGNYKKDASCPERAGGRPTQPRRSMRKTGSFTIPKNLDVENLSLV